MSDGVFGTVMPNLFLSPNFNVRRRHCYSPDEGASLELNGLPRSGSNEQYQPIVLPGQMPAAERDSKMATLSPKVDDFRISQGGNKREKLEGPGNPVVLAVASKRRVRFNLSGLIRAL